eukprot:scaffold1175_cov107-Isochrysis_galbana.AAC.2
MVFQFAEALRRKHALGNRGSCARHPAGGRSAGGRLVVGDNRGRRRHVRSWRVRPVLEPRGPRCQSLVRVVGRRLECLRRSGHVQRAKDGVILKYILLFGDGMSTYEQVRLGAMAQQLSLKIASSLRVARHIDAVTTFRPPKLSWRVLRRW